MYDKLTKQFLNFDNIILSLYIWYLVVGGYVITMEAKCCVVGCTSGYKSNTEKVSQFSAPKDHGLRQRWQKALL